MSPNNLSFLSTTIAILIDPRDIILRASFIVEFYKFLSIINIFHEISFKSTKLSAYLHPEVDPLNLLKLLYFSHF